ncbi:hypothetical protein ABFS82_04G180600 [Erythranthe guttata]
MNRDNYCYGRNSMFEQCYRCYPASFIKDDLERGDKVIMPASALDRLAKLNIDYPMLFEISNPRASKVTHCGVLEFTADEGLIYLPFSMMENMQLKDGDIVRVKNASLPKGTYVKMQPHKTDFLDVSNPKAVLETSLRSYTCLTTGDTIMVVHNNKEFYINILETKPSNAISIIETDCEVDFAPPLDYKEPEKPVKSKRPRPEADEEPEHKSRKLSSFTGTSRRLDGKPSTQVEVPDCEINSSVSKSSTRRQSGKLVFGSSAVDASLNESSKSLAKKEEDGMKFKAFTGPKYSLKD